MALVLASICFSRSLWSPAEMFKVISRQEGQPRLLYSAEAIETCYVVHWGGLPLPSLEYWGTDSPSFRWLAVNADSCGVIFST